LQQSEWVASHSPRNADELDHINPALTPFDQRHEGLVPSNSVGQIGLRETCRLPSLDQHMNKVLVVATKDRLGHLPVPNEPAVDL